MIKHFGMLIYGILSMMWLSIGVWYVGEAYPPGEAFKILYKANCIFWLIGFYFLLEKC